ncbi:heavy metal transporter [Bifidobacterium callitrichos]|uniref:Heavy metal transporter n=1 Tax=Bifidobacterium callitrichos DSM 23973 TaxID=1437609 RepID=A0A087ACS9_9BIFI|nr:heavy metal transporter [Bifidobacterium callitrichos]KFI56579.1 heavy metal transporter [Bifidobacterium callitrichos DSM 23973]
MFNLDMPWHRHYRDRIRLADAGTDAGGAGDDAGQSATGQSDADPADTIDWKAKYESMRQHSRDWEKRAKANSDAAAELEKLKESQMSDAEKTAKRIRDLEARNAAYEAEKQQNEWKTQVSKETGVPADLLHGDTLDDMKAYAKALDQWAHPKPKGMPNQGKTPSTPASGTEERSWANSLFANI